jgi:hypothetical protein
MPVVVLTASDKWVDVLPKMIQPRELPPNAPPEFAAALERAQTAAHLTSRRLVNGAVHISDTHSKRLIMIDTASGRYQPKWRSSLASSHSSAPGDALAPVISTP